MYSISGSKQKSGLSNQSVNLFQDDTNQPCDNFCALPGQKRDILRHF